jgi:hypothetical protein
LGLAFPLRDISWRHRYGGLPARRLSSTAFLTPPRICSASSLAGLFRPAATYRVLPREAPSRTGETVRHRLFALSSLTSLCCRRLPNGSTSLRLALRAFYRARVPVPSLRCLAAASVLPLVGLSSSRFSLSPSLERLHALSAHGLGPKSVESSFGLTYSVLSTASLASLSRGCRPARGFWPIASPNFR